MPSRPRPKRAASVEEFLEDPDVLPPISPVSPFRASIVAVAEGDIIGVDGRIPWRHPPDVKRLWRLTRASVIILGRLSWEDMPRRPVPGRRNFVLTSRELPGAQCFGSLEAALAAASGEDVWFLGGSRVYREAMKRADFLDITHIPDPVPVAPGETVARFPAVDPSRWRSGPLLPDPTDPGVTRRRCVRRGES